MEFDAKQSDLLRTLCKEWNAAEKAIKIAEKASVEFNSPAILELRYAGRKIIEFISLIEIPDPTIEAEAKLQDAICDCHRARHDATDHATTEITLRLDAARRQFGNRSIREIFPEYAELKADLANVREIVSNSREDRNGRARFYSKLEQEELPRIMKLYERFLVVEVELEKDWIWRFLKGLGSSIGWIIAIILSFSLWYYS